MKKIKETRLIRAGFMLGATESRIRLLEKGEPLPPGAVEVPQESPEHDWQYEESETK